MTNRIAEKAIHANDSRAAGFKSVFDYEKGESLDVLDPHDGDYITVKVTGTYTEFDGVHGLRVCANDGRHFDCPLWTIKGK